MFPQNVFPLSAFISWLLLTSNPIGYPVDGYESTGIRRLERLRLRLAGEMKGKVPPEGARKLLDEIQLHLYATPAETLDTPPSTDPELQRKLTNILADRHSSYSIALLDITPGQPIRYAAQLPDRHYQPGSVGKLAIAVGLFSELQRLFPDSVKYRKQLLRARQITADRWIVYDDHGVPFFDPKTHKVNFRPIQIGDTFLLYEWVDHMLSASSNAAASTVWKELMLMRKFEGRYPPPRELEEAFFKETPKKELQEIALSIVNDPLREMGISERDFKLGSFFTRTGKQIVPTGGSGGTPTGLLTLLMRIEQGRAIDPWSSLELKRLLYMTERRIRYASAPRLKDSAVYFKSGSLYSCKKEPGYECGKYKGNRLNYMNSVAIVEDPEGEVYLVALMSNVLKVNSAVEHQTLATYIDRMLTLQN